MLKQKQKANQKNQKYLYRNEVFLNDIKPLSKYVQEMFLISQFTERNGIKSQLNGDIFVRSCDDIELSKHF